MRKTNPVLLTIGAIAFSVLACNLPFFGEVDVNEWYVATDGSDDNRCTSDSEPCRSIHGAVEKSSGLGGIIHVSPGTYEENLLIESSISIIGADRESTIVDGGAGCTGGPFPGAVIQNEERIYATFWFFGHDRRD